ncbi:glycosyltransferase family protein [Photobacterium profundum]|nr:glycosyltransferase [Photobacterium profundum]
MRDLKRINEKITTALTNYEPPAISIKPRKIIKPLVWPLAKSSNMLKINQFLLRRQIPLKKYHRIIWAALPTAVDYLEISESDLVIYYCGDDFSALAGVDHQYVAEAEQRLIQVSDIILTASPTLQQKFPQDKTRLLPHGVAINNFKQPTSKPTEICADQPSIGFYGSINNWLDMELLKSLATSRPHINFYLVGREDIDTFKLKQLSNIHLLPACPHNQLAGYLQHWSIAILPFVDNPQIQACNPLKLREYLASGCPVISSNFPAATEYQPLVTIATTVNQWLEAIDKLSQLSELERQHYANRAQDKVKDESWENRAQEVLQLISSTLKQKKYSS